MDIAPFPHQRFDIAVSKLSDGTRREQEFGTIGEKFGRSALVGFDMSRLVTDHAVIALRATCQGQTIGCRAVKNKVDIAIGFEELPETVSCLAGPTIVTVTGLVTCHVGLLHRLPRFAANTTTIVAGELSAELGSCGR